MNSTKIPPAIQSFTENELSFELYPDGDCVVFSQATGFLQIKAETIAKLAKGSKLAIQSGRSESVTARVNAAPVAHAIVQGPDPKTDFKNAFGDPVQPKTSFAPAGDHLRRRVSRVGDTESGGWECIFLDHDIEVGRHV